MGNKFETQKLGDGDEGNTKKGVVKWWYSGYTNKQYLNIK